MRARTAATWMVAFTILSLSCTKATRLNTPAAEKTRQQLSAIDRLDSYLADPRWEPHFGPFKDSKPLPSVGTAGTPGEVLGHLYGLRPTGGATCAEARSDPNKREVVAFPKYLVSDENKCKVVPGKPTELQSFRLTQQQLTEAGLGGLLKAGSERVHLYEVTVSQPQRAHLDSQQQCLPLDALRRMRFAGYCSLTWVTGAMITRIAYRAYEKLETDVQGAYSLIKAGNHTYASWDSFATVDVMTGDQRDLSHYFETKPDGTLAGWLDNEPAAVVKASVSEELATRLATAEAGYEKRSARPKPAPSGHSEASLPPRPRVVTGRRAQARVVTWGSSVGAEARQETATSRCPTDTTLRSCLNEAPDRPRVSVQFQRDATSCSCTLKVAASSPFQPGAEGSCTVQAFCE